MITDKQQGVIRIIENNLRITFKGKTKEEATAFISEHMGASKRASQLYLADMRRLNIELMKESWSPEEDQSIEVYFDEGWYNMPH